jgi:hypothetical protein
MYSEWPPAFVDLGMLGDFFKGNKLGQVCLQIEIPRLGLNLQSHLYNSDSGLSDVKIIHCNIEFVFW